MSIAHYYKWTGDVDILGVISSVGFKKSIAALNVINVYYGGADIPLGAYKGDFGSDPADQDAYASTIINDYDNNGILNYDNVDDAPDAYVKILNE